MATRQQQNAPGNPRHPVAAAFDPPRFARSLENFSNVVHRIYDAGMHPERWGDTVALIARSLGASKGLLFTPRLAPQHGGLVFPAGIDENTLQLWGSRFIDNDIWTQRGVARGLFRGNHCWTDADLVSDEEFLVSSFYCDFLRDIDIRRVCGGVVFDGGPGLPITVLSAFRGAAPPPFERSDVEWLRRLIPHVSRSLGFMERLDMHRAQIASTRASLDRLPFGVALLDRDMKVSHLNSAARDVVERADGLAIDAACRLEVSANTRSGSLANWLCRLKDRNVLEQPHFSEGFSVARAAAGNASSEHYFVQCAPVPPAADWGAPNEEVAFVAFITDPRALRLPTPERLMDLFHLTPAQALAALELAGGASYKAVARKLRVSEETVRSHVKEIYPKTRVNRQSDLVRLVLSLAQVAV
jgi:DNA-binding CsgD family transcriptional regulator